MQKQSPMRIRRPLLRKNNQGRTILPSLLITTSRKTSNRVRSFSRDLCTALSGTERFNRGGIGLQELSARIHTSGANGAVVISMRRGNPSLLVFMNQMGKEVYTVKMESAKLRREVNPGGRVRTAGIAGVFIKTGSSEKTRDLGEILGSLLNLETVELADPGDATVDENWSMIWLEDLPSGKILWTHYHSTNKVEIGPRIRVASIRRNI